MAFKRATLGGSQDLFQPTRPDGELVTISAAATEPGAGVADPPPPRPVGHLYRLTREDVGVLVQALQQAKFPHSYQRMGKPALDDFERLEAVRQSLLRQLDDRP